MSAAADLQTIIDRLRGTVKASTISELEAIKNILSSLEKFSNRLATYTPEEYDDDGSQEACIEKFITTLIEAAKLARTFELPDTVRAALAFAFRESM